MASSEIVALISEGAVSAPSSPPDPSSVSSVAGVRQVMFRWTSAEDAGPNIYPYIWQYRYRVKNGGTPAFGSWIDTLNSFVNIPLTSGNLIDHGYDATIEIEVRSRNAASDDFSNAVAEETDCIAAVLDPADFEAGIVTVATLDPDATNRMFTDGAKVVGGIATAEDIVEGATKKFAAESDATVGAKAGTNLVDESDVSLSDADIKNSAVDTAFIVATGVEVDDLGGYLVAQADAAITARLSAAEKANLALDKTIDGTNLLYHVGNKPTSADVGLTAVVDKNSADMVEDGINDTILGVETTAVLTAGLMAAINNDAGTINSARIANIAATKVVHSAVARFDGSGRLTAELDDGAGNQRSIANLTKAVNASGECVELNLSAANFTGDTADIPEDAAHVFNTANEKLGSGYAHTGLDSSGRVKVGIVYGGNSVTAGEAYNRIKGRRPIGGRDEENTAGLAVFTDLAISLGGGAYNTIIMKSAILSLGDLTWYAKLNCAAADAGSLARLTVRDSSGALILSGTPVAIPTPAKGIIELSVVVGGLAFSDGDLLQARIEIDTQGNVVTIADWGISAGI